MPAAPPNLIRLRRTSYLPYDLPDFVGGMIVVNVLTGLSTVDDLAIDNGALVWVESRKRYFMLDKLNTDALLDGQVVATKSGAGRWVSLDWTSSIHWAIVYAAVFIDPAAGSDDNDGLNAGTALKTFAELARRVPVLRQSIAVNYNSATSPAATDVLAWNPIVRWDRNLTATVPAVSINGVITAGALPAGATGILATSSNVVGNVPAQISDTGGAGVAWPVGTLLEATSGASSGARSYVMLDEGAGVASVGVWRNAAGTANATPPAPGDTYRVITLTQVPNVELTGTAFFTLKNLHVLEWSQTAQCDSPAITFNLCKLLFTTFAPAGGTSVVMNSSFYGGGTVFLVSSGVVCNCSGTSFDRRLVTQRMRCSSGGRLLLSNGYIQGAAGSSGLAIAGPFASDGIPGGVVGASNFGVRGVTATAAIEVRKGGLLNVTGALWGSGNTGKGTTVLEGGRCSVLSTVTPTLASVGQELELDGQATAIPALVGGLVVPVAAALTTWAQWAAAPFTRNVVGYQATNQNSQITDAA